MDADHDGTNHHNENNHHDVAHHDNDVTDHHHNVADDNNHDDHDHDHDDDAVDDDELHHGPVRAGTGADPGSQPGSPSAPGLSAAGVPTESLGLVAHWIYE